MDVTVIAGLATPEAAPDLESQVLGAGNGRNRARFTQYRDDVGLVHAFGDAFDMAGAAGATDEAQREQGTKQGEGVAHD